MIDATKRLAHKGMMRRCLAIPALALLCSCAVTVEQAEIRLTDDERTSYSAVVTAGAFDKGRMEKHEQDFKNCGMRVRRFRTDDKPFSLAVTLPDVPPQDIATYMRCLPGGALVEVGTNKYVGWLYTYYDLEVRIAMPRCLLRRSATEADPNHVEASRIPAPAILPRSFKLRLPGRISASELEADVQGMGFRRQDEESLTTVTAVLPDGYKLGKWPNGEAYCRQFLPRYQGDFDQKFETDKFRVAVHSKRAEFSLPTLFSVAGLLISSGIVAAIIRRFIPGPSKTPATGDQGSASAPARGPRRRKRDG